MRSICAVIDTNVLISALLTSKTDVSTVKVLNAFFEGKIHAIVHDDILAEYENVLSRPKFHFSKDKIETLVNAFASNGIFLDSTKSSEVFPDQKDIIFYEITLTAISQFNEAYLVTGNKKHFPVRTSVVSPTEFIQILEEELNLC